MSGRSLDVRVFTISATILGALSILSQTVPLAHTIGVWLAWAGLAAVLAPAVHEAVAELAFWWEFRHYEQSVQTLSRRPELPADGPEQVPAGDGPADPDGDRAQVAP